MSACPKCPHCTEIRKAKSKAAVLAKPPSRRSEKQQARKEHRQSTKEIRAAVMARSGGFCEAWAEELFACHEGFMELGGSGRRRQMQSVQTTWLLCAHHHRARTDGIPAASWWNDRFAHHCAKHGYPPPTLHAEKPPLPSRFRRPHVEKSPGA